MSNRTRTRLATGIYRDKFGIALVISVQGRAKEFRTDSNGHPYKDRALSWLLSERTDKLATAQQLEAITHAKADTFTADVDRYLRTIASPSHVKNATRLLALWAEAFGDRRRNDITEVEIQEAFAQWSDKAPSTRNHLRHVLIAFYQTLNGRQGINPARVLRKVRERYDDARALPYETITRIFNALELSPSKARLMVMAYTGLPQTQIERLQPSDLRLRKRVIYVRPRRKGAGVPGRLLPLSDAGVEALRAFVQVNAFGPFQRKQLQKVFAHGILWAKVTVPAGTRPYDLRHSFLTEVYRQTGDLSAVAELGMHATLEQTARYARGAVSERATKAVRATNWKRGTGGKSSNTLQFSRVHEAGAKGSNQYRKRTKRPKHREKSTLRARSSVG